MIEIIRVQIKNMNFYNLKDNSYNPMQNGVKINKDISLEGVNSFEQTNIAAFLIQCLTKCGFIRPTPIQYHSITNFIKYPHHSIIAQSKSGTGKTLSFLIPILNQLCSSKDLQTQTVCLIILPTRELSIQVHQYLKQLITSANEIKALLAEREFKNTLKGMSSLLTIGGIPIEDDKKTLLTSGANFVIGTVGRICQLLQSGYLKVEKLKFAILDEGDKLFATKDEKLEKILKRIHNMLKNKGYQDSQTIETSIFRFMVYSATYDQKSIKKITQTLSKILTNESITQAKFLYIQTLTNSLTNQFVQKVTQNWRQLNFVTFAPKNYSLVDGQGNSAEKTSAKEMQENTELISLENIKKFCLKVENSKGSIIVRKCDKLKQILSQLQYKKCLIFVEKKALLQQIYDEVKEFEPLLIHGSLSQASRIKAMNQANKSKIVISSDLLARGIDLVLDLVVLFDAHINETFWHRIGRTGRFGRVGVVVSLDKIENWEQYDARLINSILKESITQEQVLKKNEWYGTYMTEYGRWEDVNAENQEILNKGYNFYEESQNMQLSKKHKKEIKQLQKKVEKEVLVTEKKLNLIQENLHSHKTFTLKSTFRTQEQFTNYYEEIFKCASCFNLMQKMSQLTGKQFKLLEYFKQN